MQIDKAAFDSAYDRVILGNSFFEGDDYYAIYRDRYWNTFQHIARLGLGPGASMIDIGSGQFALLCRELLGMKGNVADIDLRWQEDLAKMGVDVMRCDLAAGPLETDQRFDLIVIAEVIEHVPRAPRVVLAELRDRLTEGGYIVLTTPNFFRLRNLIRMVMNKEILDPFNPPAPDSPIGHFVEYSIDHMRLYTEEAGLKVVHAGLEQLSMGGASAKARLARKVTRPLTRALPHLRDNLVVVAQR